jgi:hypothetical protein
VNLIGPAQTTDLGGRYLVVVDGVDSWFRSGDEVDVTETDTGIRVTGPPWTSNRSGEPVYVDHTRADGALYVARHLRRIP